MFGNIMFILTEVPRAQEKLDLVNTVGENIRETNNLPQSYHNLGTRLLDVCWEPFSFFLDFASNFLPRESPLPRRRNRSVMEKLDNFSHFWVCFKTRSITSLTNLDRKARHT